MKALERQGATLKALGRIEGFTFELKRLKGDLGALTLWRPAAGLCRQCDEALRMIEGIAGRLDRSLVVTVIGPSGSGKSTLVNALAGGDAISPTGHRRPTTERVVIFDRNGEDAAELARDLGADAAAVRAAEGGRLPEGICLIDTPDTDSMANRRHLPMLERAVAHSDVLICVFDAENPKRRDHVDTLAPIVRRFDGESLVVVLNKCDRLDEVELQERILPDFLEYLRSAWGGAAAGVLCISARSHLREPAWDPAAGPRHGFDQYAGLTRIVFGEMGRSGFAIDRRTENARRLHDVVRAELWRALADDRAALEEAGRRLSDLHAEAAAAALQALRSGDVRLPPGMGAAVYRQLAQRWVGPVGWVLALWARLLSFGSGVGSVLRLRRPLSRNRQVSLERRSQAGENEDGRLKAAIDGFRLALLKRWPDAAEMLVRGRFDPAVRAAETADACVEAFSGPLTALWAEAVEAESARIPSTLGGFWLQALLNAPVAGLIGYVGWVAVVSFFRGDYLGGGFFVHAFWLIGIALALGFFLLQVLIRLFLNPARIAGRAARRCGRGLTPGMRGPATELSAQLLTLRGLMAALLDPTEGVYRV
ncbi:MAG: GTPase [Desulfobacterales bacterium]